MNAISKEVWQQFVRLASNLSPENLSCDGELSRAQVRKRYTELTRQWKALEKQVGRQVTENEVWTWFSANRGAR